MKNIYSSTHAAILDCFVGNCCSNGRCGLMGASKSLIVGAAAIAFGCRFGSVSLENIPSFRDFAVSVRTEP